MKISRRSLIVAGLLIGSSGAAMAALWDLWKTTPPSRDDAGRKSTTPKPGPATVAQRLAQYGEAARERLRPAFERAGIVYPPSELVLLAIKKDYRLELYARGAAGEPKFLKSYTVRAASGRLGPKLRQGDYQVPEGFYRVELLNPNSAYHLSLRLNYPNAFDRERGRADGRRSLGGDIMIHGNEVSIGCIAIGDPAIEELFVLSADTGLRNIRVLIVPLDFRKPHAPADLPQSPAWTGPLYKELKEAVEKLPHENKG